MSAYKDLKNFIINKVEGRDVYDYMLDNNLVNEDELYLVQNDDYHEATSTESGLMSSQDKIKLDNIQDGATKVTDDERASWNDANSKKHTHSNKSVLDGITSALITAWNQAVEHISNSIIHITSTERTNWNSAKTHADSAHAPSNAEANQNAFSNIKVGTTTVAADTTTDTLTLEGSNVTLTPDATNDKVTIGITKDNVTEALGYTPPTTNTTYEVVSTAANGLAPKRDGSTTTFLRGDGIWAIPPDTTYSAADSFLGLVKTGGSVTISNGVITVNDYSHKHTIDNIDGLKSALEWGSF